MHLHRSHGSLLPKNRLSPVVLLAAVIAVVGPEHDGGAVCVRAVVERFEQVPATPIREGSAGQAGPDELSPGLLSDLAADDETLSPARRQVAPQLGSIGKIVFVVGGSSTSATSCMSKNRFGAGDGV